MGEASPPIVYVSNAGWSYGLPTNRQQLPLRLAKHVPVLYASPFSLSQVALGNVRLRAYQPRLTRIDNNLHLVHVIRILPMVRGQIWPLTVLDREIQTQTIQNSIRRLGLEAYVLWLYFPPSFAYLSDRLQPALTCYHCTDDHAGYARALGLPTEPLARAETDLVQHADVVLTTSRPLYEQKRSLNPNTYLMPNVADVDRFRPISEGKQTVASELANLGRPIVGFVGAVDRYKVDLELVTTVARALPDWSFVFVGPVGSGDGTKQSDLPSAPNLHFLGAKPYTSLPAYIAGFDVCIIPYALNNYTAGVFPLKFWEYLASGKPVVTTPLPALTSHYNAVEVAENADAFIAALKRAAAAAGDKAAIQRRTALAANQSWEARAAEILDVLRKHL